jgi:D-glycero-D-manno-heptose 1,7-bisphosphate phosphatase
MRQAVFLERDGILNLCDTVNGEQVTPLRSERFRINPAARKALEELKAAGFVLIVTTNQPSVSQGILPRRELDRMHALLFRQLPIDDIFVCPHADWTHPSCKPQPGMFLEAGFKWGIDLDQSFVISDKEADAKAGQIAGCTSVMVQSPWIGSEYHDFVVGDLQGAVQRILGLVATDYSRNEAGL